MSRIRPEFLKGLVVLGLFFVLIVSTDLFFPYPIEQNGYTVIDLRRAHEDALLLDGHNVTSIATIENWLPAPYSVALTEENVQLTIRDLSYHPQVGDRVYFRGTFHVHYYNASLNIIDIRVHEIYVIDENSSLIRSVPGIILFVVMFFMIFTVDFKRVAFVLRRRD
jgi:hypothetical protein